MNIATEPHLAYERSAKAHRRAEWARQEIGMTVEFLVRSGHLDLTNVDPISAEMITKQIQAYYDTEDRYHQLHEIYLTCYNNHTAAREGTPSA